MTNHRVKVFDAGNDNDGDILLLRLFGAEIYHHMLREMGLSAESPRSILKNYFRRLLRGD